MPTLLSTLWRKAACLGEEVNESEVCFSTSNHHCCAAIDWCCCSYWNFVCRCHWVTPKLTRGHCKLLLRNHIGYWPIHPVHGDRSSALPLTSCCSTVCGKSGTPMLWMVWKTTMSWSFPFADEQMKLKACQVERVCMHDWARMGHHREHCFCSCWGTSDAKCQIWSLQADKFRTRLIVLLWFGVSPSCLPTDCNPHLCSDKFLTATESQNCCRSLCHRALLLVLWAKLQRWTHHVDSSVFATHTKSVVVAQHAHIVRNPRRIILLSFQTQLVEICRKSEKKSRELCPCLLVSICHWLSLRSDSLQWCAMMNAFPTTKSTAGFGSTNPHKNQFCSDPALCSKLNCCTTPQNNCHLWTA